jgi:hypothetical protein
MLASKGDWKVHSLFVVPPLQGVVFDASLSLIVNGGIGWWVSFFFGSACWSSAGSVVLLRLTADRNEKPPKAKNREDSQ